MKLPYTKPSTMFVIDHVLPTISPNFFIYIPVLFGLFLVVLYGLLQKFCGCKRFCLNPVVLIGIANITVWMNSIKDTAVWKLNQFHIFYLHIRNNSCNNKVIKKLVHIICNLLPFPLLLFCFCNSWSGKLINMDVAIPKVNLSHILSLRFLHIALL